MASGKSPSALAEDQRLAAAIAKAEEFSICLHLGPGNRHTERGFATYELAKTAAAKLNQISKFGRKTLIYAITPIGSVPVSEELAALAETIKGEAI